MAVEFANESPLAAALQNLVQPKLAEYGWTTGGEDTTIFEYILLMLANDKNEAQIASELSNDLLDLGPENVETQQFARWLFEQIEHLRQQLNGGGAGDAEVAESTEFQMDGNAPGFSPSAQDTEMDGGASPSSGNIPTGPKAMRNGSGPKQARGSGRMINQLNKQMNRTDDSALHRVRGSQGVGRINSHSREPPKGPRNQQIGRGLDAMANGRGMGSMNSMVNVSMPPGPMNGMAMGGMPGMPGMPSMPVMPGTGMAPMGQNGMPGMLNTQQHMALMQMYEQQAHMMQQILQGQTPPTYPNTNFGQGNRNGNKRSSDKSIRMGSKQGLPPSTKFTKKESQDENMTEGGPITENGDNMEVETTRKEPSNTMCRWNMRCGNPECVYVHQSPAAPDGTPVDMNDECQYGAACTNHKCVGKHPSPARKQKFQAEQECAFHPNCRDQAHCPYKHPSVSPCRNGADCTKPGCTFWHTKVMCKFAPCTNMHCPYKHVEGQKQKQKKSNKWVAPKTEDNGANGEEAKKEHVSERKFIDEAAAEELIIPGKIEEDVDVEI
ncbi:hypothetical protein BDV95DRAFT_556546 [Massariosphaeria phaeospora]|uniref:Nab2-like CCCH zinc finger domain-containing protein n=1 Tax=Massariosphaeria phaeospora TaxID=100035 RepID=A0A7C8IFD4_9PLEO|nr:hypothetical protein BDV95DRAFT_556546 [Massariosphaeria phaeospora]